MPDKPSATMPVITVDGPGGAGKGMVCAMLHRWLGWQVLDSGLLYRAVALATLDSGLDSGLDAADGSDCGEELLKVASVMDCQLRTDSDGHPRLFISGRDRTADARTEDTAKMASNLAKMPQIRKLLLPYQRNYLLLPGFSGLIADGRDMGTVVFPDATVKIFLKADSSVRAARRHKQLKDMGISANMQQLDEVIRGRDKSDSERSISPLTMAADALVIDTTNMDRNEVLQKIIQVVSKKLDLAVPDPSFFMES